MKLKLYSVDFNPMYPVPSGLIILAHSKVEALEIAAEAIKHDKPLGIKEIEIDKSKIVFYESGDY